MHKRKKSINIPSCMWYLFFGEKRKTADVADFASISNLMRIQKHFKSNSVFSLIKTHENLLWVPMKRKPEVLFSNSWSIRNPVDCLLRQLYIIYMHQIFHQLKVLAMMSFIQFWMRTSFNVFPIKKADFGDLNKLLVLFYFIITQLYIDQNWNGSAQLLDFCINILKTIPCRWLA